MKQVIFVCFFFLHGVTMLAQEVMEMDTLQQKSPVNANIIPYAQWNEVFGRQMAYGGCDLEIIYKERLVFGAFGEVMLGTFLKRIVFPNIYEFSNYKYGLLVGYNFPHREKLVFTGRFKFSRQNVKWTEQEGEYFSLSDDCMEIRPLLGIQYIPVKKLLVGGAVGYNITQGLDLSGISQQDMNGIVLSLNIGLRF